MTAEVQQKDPGNYISVHRRSETEGIFDKSTKRGARNKIGSRNDIGNEGRIGFTKILPLPFLNQIVTLSYENVAHISDLVEFEALAQIPHPDVNRRFIDVAWNEEYEELVLLDDAGMIFIYDSKTSRFRATMMAGKNVTCVITIPTGDISDEALQSSSFSAPSMSAAMARRKTSVLLKRVLKPAIWVAHCERIDRVRVERYKTFVEHHGHTGRIVELFINPSSLFYGTGQPSPRRSIGAPTAESPQSPEGVVTAAGREEFAQFFLASAAADSTIRLWSPSMVCLATLVEHSSEISCMCVIASLPWIITGHDSGSLKFWSLCNDKSFRFTGHENTITTIAEGHHRCIKGHLEPWQHIFSISYDGCLAIWELPLEGSKAKCEGRLRVSHCELLCAAYDTINATYIVGDTVGRISIWSVEDLKPVRMLNRNIIPGALNVAAGDKKGPQLRAAHSEAVTCLALDGNLLISGSEDEHLYIWNTANGDLVKELTVGDAGPFASPDETIGELQHFIVLPERGDILACTRNGYLIVYSQSSGLALSYYKMNSEVARVAYNRFSRDVLAGRDDGLIVKIPLALFRLLHHRQKEELRPDPLEASDSFPAARRKSSKSPPAHRSSSSISPPFSPSPLESQSAPSPRPT